MQWVCDCVSLLCRPISWGYHGARQAAGPLYLPDSDDHATDLSVCSHPDKTGMTRTVSIKRIYDRLEGEQVLYRLQLNFIITINILHQMCVVSTVYNHQIQTVWLYFTSNVCCLYSLQPSNTDCVAVFFADHQYKVHAYI